jgi:hypothetical protein
MVLRVKAVMRPIKNNSLSIVLFALFLISVSAQSFAGWRLQNETLAQSVHRHLPGGSGHQLAGRVPAAWLADRIQRFPISARRTAFP